MRGKRALITGASSGVGRSCALLLAEQGVDLVLIARREDRLQEVRNEILANHPGVDVMVFVFDITKYKEIAALPEKIGEIDFLINNAGLALGTLRADEVNMEDVETLMQTNVSAAIAFFRAFVPKMRAKNYGHVVNVGSVAAFECYEGGSIYNATKHALLGFTNAARMDLADTNVKVSMINSGVVDSEFWLVRFNGNADLARAALQGLEPLTPWDIADQILFALTRPNGQIAEIRSYANHQAHAKYVIKRNL